MMVRRFRHSHEARRRRRGKHRLASRVDRLTGALRAVRRRKGARPYSIRRTAAWGAWWLMLKSHPFTTKVDPDLLTERRFRWTVCEGGQIHLRSPHSYLTRRQAEIEADKALLRVAEAWPGRG